MDSAIFEFNEQREFRVGIYVKEWGGPSLAGYLDEVFDNLSHENFLSTLLVLAVKRFSFFLQVSKAPTKNPFSNQLNLKGEPEYPQDLYWFSRLSENKLIGHNIYSPTKYKFFFNKKSLKLIVQYNNNEKIFSCQYTKINYRELLGEVVEWAAAIDKELADCDCLN